MTRNLSTFRAKRKREYDRWYHSEHGRPSKGARIPADIERRAVSGPCFRCGAGPTPCRHRLAEFA